jgi:two-component system response regulator GlrR
MGNPQAIGQESRSFDEPFGRRREDRIVGSSRATQRAIEQARAASRDDLPVALLGPAGSGREFLARAIHGWSRRREAGFHVFACDSVPGSLQARELFGCVAGSHPTMPGEYPGLLRSVDAGSLLIERPQALAADVRATLMHALREGRFRRQGGSSDERLEARLFVSCEPNASFFEDVPHHEVRLAPLAERSEDVLPLAAHFLASFARDGGYRPVGFTPEARSCLLAEQLSEGGALTAEALLLAADGGDVPSFKEAKRAFETRYVTGLLRRCNGNISRAARMAKKDRKDFYDVIRRTGIDPQQFRS